MLTESTEELNAWVRDQVSRLGHIPLKCPECGKSSNNIESLCESCNRPILTEKTKLRRFGQFGDEFVMIGSGLLIVAVLLFLYWAIYPKFTDPNSRRGFLLFVFVVIAYFSRGVTRHFKRSIAAVALPTRPGERYFLLADRYATMGSDYRIPCLAAYAQGILLGDSLVEHGCGNALHVWSSLRAEEKSEIAPFLEAYGDLLAGTLMAQFLTADGTKVGFNFRDIFSAVVHDGSSRTREIARIIAASFRGKGRRYQVLVGQIEKAAPAIARILQGEPDAFPPIAPEQSFESLNGGLVSISNSIITIKIGKQEIARMKRNEVRHLEILSGDGRRYMNAVALGCFLGFGGGFCIALYGIVGRRAPIGAGEAMFVALIAGPMVGVAALTALSWMGRPRGRPQTYVLKFRIADGSSQAVSLNEALLSRALETVKMTGVSFVNKTGTDLDLVD